MRALAGHSTRKRESKKYRDINYFLVPPTSLFIRQLLTSRSKLVHLQKFTMAETQQITSIFLTQQSTPQIHSC